MAELFDDQEYEKRKNVGFQILKVKAENESQEKRTTPHLPALSLRKILSALFLLL
jgi:hypothetical protein